MHTFLTVDPCEYEIRNLYRFATLKDTGLADALRPVWPENPRLLMVAADPEDDTTTENLALDLATALSKAGLEVGEVRVLQKDTAEHGAQLLAGAHVIVLAAGDEAKRAAFFSSTGLPALIANASGETVVVGLEEAALAAAGLCADEGRTFE